MATPRPSRPSRVRFETRDVRVARSSTGVRCTCGLRSRWRAAPQRMPRLDKYPPAQVKLIVYASAREFGANTVSDMARFPANTSVLLKKSDESQTQSTPDPRYLRSFSRAVRQKLGPTRIFSTAFTSSSSGRHLGSQTALPTVARCTVAMWTDGRSARPLTWARRTRVRVFARTHATPYASTPRLPESAPSAPLTRRHSPAATPVPTLTSPPPRADQGGEVRRVVCTGRAGEGCRTLLVYPQVRARRGRVRSRNVSQKRVTTSLSAESSATVVFSTTAFTSRFPRRRAVASPSRRRRHDDTLFNHPHRLTGTHTHVTSHTSLPTRHFPRLAPTTRRALRMFGARCARR